METWTTQVLQMLYSYFKGQVRRRRRRPHNRAGDSVPWSVWQTESEAHAALAHPPRRPPPRSGRCLQAAEAFVTVGLNQPGEFEHPGHQVPAAGAHYSRRQAAAPTCRCPITRPPAASRRTYTPAGSSIHLPLSFHTHGHTGCSSCEPPVAVLSHPPQRGKRCERGPLFG